MTNFVQILRGVLYIAGAAAIGAIGYIITQGGHPRLGNALTQGFIVLSLLLLCVQWLLFSKRRRALRKIRQAKSAPLRIFSTLETASYRHNVDAVWGLIRPAENAVLLSDCERAFSVPGTPKGVGEQQCFIGRDGTTSIVEVIAEDAPHWAATRIVSPPGTPEIRVTYRLEPTQAGCDFTYGMDFEAPSTFIWSGEPQRKWRASARQYLHRVEHALELQHPLPLQD